MSALDDFTAWKLSSVPGQRFEYYRGYIAKQVATVKSAAAIKSAVVEAYLSGDFDLTQLRHGLDDYSYFIVRRAKHDAELRLWISGEREARKDMVAATKARRAA
jgi:hypothetical protein